MRQLIVLTAALVFSSLDAQAADLNVASVFPDRTHDFGTVARGSQLRHRFRIVNTTGQELRIAETRTKCGCTEVKLGAKVIPARAESYVDAVLDTTKFLGPKKSGLTLIIDRPVFSEVDLNLNCFIRGDILVNPGQVEFGNVPHGKSTSRVLTLEYQGVAAGWQITGMNTISSAISAKLDPPVRTTGGGLQYSLTATLNPSAPVGFLKEEIELITNDPNSPHPAFGLWERPGRCHGVSRDDAARHAQAVRRGQQEGAVEGFQTLQDRLAQSSAGRDHGQVEFRRRKDPP